METPKAIRVLVDGKTLDLDVDEYVPIDPAAYQHEAGWTCFAGDVEYFVSLSGDVWLQPENLLVGHAPVVREAADKLEAMVEDWQERSPDSRA